MSLRRDFTDDISSLCGIPLRASLGPAEKQIVRLYREIEASQWWSAEALFHWQRIRLAHLLEHARQHVPFYAELLRDFRFDPNAGVGMDFWRMLPLLKKEQVRSDAARLRSAHLRPDEKVIEKQTSGSTGMPLKVYYTSSYVSCFLAAKLRHFLWHCRDMRGKYFKLTVLHDREKHGAVLRHKQWEYPTGELFETGPFGQASIFMDVNEQLAVLENEAPDILMTHSSNLQLLLRTLRKSARRLPSIRLVFTQAERFDPVLRAECRELFGARMVDTYGATECGYLALQCPDHPHYHVQSELTFVEILREDGSVCEPGETGRIVVTPLHALAMPLLRYDLGDYAEVGEHCPCGRGLPVVRRIFGRERELLTLSSGEKRYSTHAPRIFADMPMVRQFQIVQKSLIEIEARIVPERPLEKAECDRILDGLAKQIGPQFMIRLVFVDSIPRPPSGKYMEFISEIGASSSGASA